MPTLPTPLALLAALPMLLSPAAFGGAAAATAPQAAPEPAATERAAADWRRRAGGEQRSKHYRILSDLSPGETRLLGRHLDLMYEEYARRLGEIPPATRAPLAMMFAQETDYAAVMRVELGTNAAGTRGAFVSSPAGSVLAFHTGALPQREVLEIAQREGFRQFAHGRFAGRLPAWVAEGLAECFAEALVIDGQVVVGLANPRATDDMKREIERGTVIDLTRMLSMTGEEWKANERAGGGVQGLQAWSMVQYLGWGDGGRHQRSLDLYLRLLHGGTPSSRAFAEAFGTADAASFERAWRTWAGEQAPSAFSAAALRVSFLADGLRRLSDEGVVVGSVEDLVSELRQRRFALELTIAGRAHRIEADDDFLELPANAPAAGRPSLELVPDGRPGRTATRPADSPPPVVTTRGLAPRELALVWRRHGAAGGFSYELVAPKSAERPSRRTPPNAGGAGEPLPDRGGPRR